MLEWIGLIELFEPSQLANLNTDTTMQDTNTNREDALSNGKKETLLIIFIRVRIGSVLELVLLTNVLTLEISRHLKTKIQQ